MVAVLLEHWAHIWFFVPSTVGCCFISLLACRACCALNASCAMLTTDNRSGCQSPVRIYRSWSSLKYALLFIGMTSWTRDTVQRSGCDVRNFGVKLTANHLLGVPGSWYLNNPAQHTSDGERRGVPEFLCAEEVVTQPTWAGAGRSKLYDPPSQAHAAWKLLCLFLTLSSEQQ